MKGRTVVYGRIWWIAIFLAAASVSGCAIGGTARPAAPPDRAIPTSTPVTVTPVAKGVPVLDVHQAALRAARAEKFINQSALRDVKCPAPAKRATADTVLC